MPQESPASLSKQLGSYPHPCEESQQLAPTRPAEPCPALCVQPGSQDGPCGLVRARLAHGWSPNRVRNQERQCHVAVKNKSLWNLADPDLTPRVCWVTWDKLLCLFES